VVLSGHNNLGTPSQSLSCRKPVGAFCSFVVRLSNHLIGGLTSKMAGVFEDKDVASEDGEDVDGEDVVSDDEDDEVSEDEDDEEDWWEALIERVRQNDPTLTELE
jgi:hypothetical protein